MRLAGPLLVAASVCFSSAACRSIDSNAAAWPAVIETDLNAALARGAKEGRPVFVHFTAAWCLPCKQIKETVYPDPAVEARLARFVRAEIDIESSDGDASARRYGVRAVPVLTFIDSNGEELRSLRLAGVETAGEMVVALDRALAVLGLQPVAAAPSIGDASAPH